MPTELSSIDVRDRLCDALDLDLVGPAATSTYADERLDTAPSRWYLTGFLAPKDSEPDEKEDVDGDDELEAAERDSDEAVPAERAAALRARFPSSMGLSVLVQTATRALEVLIRWGDYVLDPKATPVAREVWRRVPRSERVSVPLDAQQGAPLRIDVPNSHGLELALSLRAVTAAQVGVPTGTRVASLFLVNERRPRGDAERDLAFAFQVELEVHCGDGFVDRANERGRGSDDVDERIADLQFRDVREWAVGHGVATQAEEVGARCQVVRTRWIPSAEVERVVGIESVEPAKIAGVELKMEALAQLANSATARARLLPLVQHYRDWIAQQRKTSLPEKRRADTADDLLRRAERAAVRIEAGIEALADPQVFQAFTLANKVMAVAARQRQSFGGKTPPDPTWRPFQLAFLLLNLKSLAVPTDADREIVDLLFFPTGGGKTEAYLGLAAYTLVLRRLRHPGIESAGVAVLMRYTLRLLTLDQLSRAATLICALELERQERGDLLGPWPFEIGLWVGQSATPNRMGKKGDNDRYSARAKVDAYARKERNGSPVPLENCPWCNGQFTPRSFKLVPIGADAPQDLRIYCANRDCRFTRDALPIITVDDPIYRRLPCFLIATVDKFAAMPWTGEVGALFGRVERFDPRDGFFGPCELGRGAPLPKGSLPPPDLVIQDELHLISGPLGTIAGLYESALDALCSRPEGEREIRPKIVASTATVRRAESQIRALFARSETAIFPPPGIDRRDSFFARTVAVSHSPARRYLGVAAQGRSLKVVLLRVYRTLLSAAQKLYDEAGGKRAKDANAADAYMTLLGYFTSLRELGGSRRIVEDEVNPRVADYQARRRVGEEIGPFANRAIAREPVELTSRVPTHKVAEAKSKLALPHSDEKHVDVALATNMISVGLDITRLGLMVVLGQPKTSAEYIQSTSRVGRDSERPGLVVTLLNIHRPRDRSHYERFGFYHATFYRAVEASSVTPFSPRALDRALAGTVVALARHGHAPMTAPLGAGAILSEQGRLGFVVDALGRRAAAHANLPGNGGQEIERTVRARTQKLLDTWSGIANDLDQTGTKLQYQHERGGAQPLLFTPLDPDLVGLAPNRRAFRANRSMRDVEASVNLWMKTLDGHEVEGEEVEE